ncbi:MAG: ATP phosphoribosyltransferase regulatory subunit [Pseudomonadota bacterium]
MSIDALMATLDGASAARIQTALLQPADTFVALAGEEFRTRLFTTEDASGKPLCLRPDFTIPVCLEHLKSGAQTPTVYSYRGPIFRKHRTTGEPEFEQAGAEWLGHADEVATDAMVFATAAECARVVGLTPKIRIGDANVFAALSQALGLSKSWQSRLSATFGDRRRLDGSLKRLSGETSDNAATDRLASALAHLGPTEARAIIDAVLAGHSRGPVAGRTADDIAERILDLAAINGGNPAAVSVINDYLTLSGPLASAADTLTAFAARHDLALGPAIARFSARTEALAAAGLDPAHITFEAAFGRRLGYYTGLVFEFANAEPSHVEVIAGGRYNALATMLRPGVTLPGIGFSVWLDRLPPSGAPS